VIFGDKWLDVLAAIWPGPRAGGFESQSGRRHGWACCNRRDPGGCCGQRSAGTSGRDELADVGRQALGRLGYQAALDGLAGGLGHGPDDVGGLRLIDSRALGDPGDDVLAAEPLADPGPGVDLGAPQVLADLVRELRGQVAGQPLGDPLAEGLRDPRGWRTRRRRGWIAGPDFASGR
jgi:hypothetical protein